MLRIHVVRDGGYHYYVDDLVPGRAEGSLVAGEEPGVWSGSGASALGLRGGVESAVFGEVLDGRDPRSGQPLRHHGPRSVAGYDLTFAAPKSVSVLHLLAPREIANQVGAGHHAAVREATEYLGRAGVGVRRNRQGEMFFLSSTGPVAGDFVHRTSRALDPHLHTHVVMANVAQGVDGQWSALDSRRLFAHSHAARGIYHARLRLELGDRIGASWSVSPSGLGDVVGVDDRLRRLFSQRAASMDEYQFRRVGSLPVPSRSKGAFHANRPDKDRSHTVDSLMAEWKERAADFGFDLGDLTRVVGPRRSLGTAVVIDERHVRTALGHLADRKARLAQHDLVAVVAAASTTGASARVIESVASHLAEAAGAPRPGPRRPSPTAGLSRGMGANESRWEAEVVTRVVERQASALLSDPTGMAAGRAPTDGTGALPTSIERDGERHARAERRQIQREPHQLGR